MFLVAVLTEQPTQELEQEQQGLLRIIGLVRREIQDAVVLGHRRLLFILGVVIGRLLWMLDLFLKIGKHHHLHDNIYFNKFLVLIFKLVN